MPAFCFLFCVCENFNICYYQLPYYFMVITLIILVLSAVFFMSGKVRSDLVALCALISLLIFLTCIDVMITGIIVYKTFGT